jgi:hypothetical protein
MASAIMGYSTAFTGQLALSRPPTDDECATLRASYEHRHEEEEDLPLPYVVAEDCPVLIERTLKNRIYYGEAPGLFSKKPGVPVGALPRPAHS